MSEVGNLISSSRRDRGSAALEWYGVQDPRQRKKIQDRLAQRAHRRSNKNPIGVV